MVTNMADTYTRGLSAGKADHRACIDRELQLSKAEPFAGCFRQGYRHGRYPGLSERAIFGMKGE